MKTGMKTKAVICGVVVGLIVAISVSAFALYTSTDKYKIKKELPGYVLQDIQERLKDDNVKIDKLSISRFTPTSRSEYEVSGHTFSTNKGGDRKTFLFVAKAKTTPSGQIIIEVKRRLSSEGVVDVSTPEMKSFLFDSPEEYRKLWWGS